MARSYAPVYTSIWRDDAFCSLSAAAQRVYLMALSQPNVSYCGVVSFTPRRWAGMAKDTTARVVSRAVEELIEANYVLLDVETEELWVRSFVKHNKVLEQPKIAALMRREYDHIHSTPIRRAFAAEYPGTVAGHPDTPADTPPHTPDEGYHDSGGSGYGSVPPTGECSSPEPEPSSSSSTAEDDDGMLLESVWPLLARRKLRDQRDAGQVIGNDVGWLATTAMNARAERWDEAAALHAEYPSLSAQEIANVLCGEASVLRFAARRPA